MKIKKQEKTIDLKYPEKSVVYSNPKETPIFSILLASLTSDNISFSALGGGQHVELEGMPQTYFFSTRTLYLLYLISAIALITTITYFVKFRKLKNVVKSSDTVEENTDNENEEKIKKTKKKLIISSVVLGISFVAALVFYCMLLFY